MFAMSTVCVEAGSWVDQRGQSLDLGAAIPGDVSSASTKAAPSTVANKRYVVRIRELSMPDMLVHALANKTGFTPI